MLTTKITPTLLIKYKHENSGTAAYQRQHDKVVMHRDIKSHATWIGLHSLHDPKHGNMYLE